MLIDLKCECCGCGLQADFSNNVWCENTECLVFNKCYTHDFIEMRAEAKANNEPVPQKDRMQPPAGW